MFSSSIVRTISAAHRNGPPGQRCYNNHGHDWKVVVEFVYETLDKHGWGPDFGKVAEVIRTFDHADLNEKLAPLAPSAENFARVLAELIKQETGHRPDSVEVHEGGGNSVRYIP